MEINYPTISGYNCKLCGFALNFDGGCPNMNCESNTQHKWNFVYTPPPNPVEERLDRIEKVLKDIIQELRMS